MKGIRSRIEIRRHELLGKAQRPAEVKSVSEVPMAIENWEVLLREYIECGGRQPLFEEKRQAILSILPG